MLCTRKSTKSTFRLRNKINLDLLFLLCRGAVGTADGREGRGDCGDGRTTPSKPGENEDRTGDGLQVPQFS